MHTATAVTHIPDDNAALERHGVERHRDEVARDVRKGRSVNLMKSATRIHLRRYARQEYEISLGYDTA